MSADISGPHPYARWPSALQEDCPRRARFFLLCAYSVFSVAEQEAAAKNERFARDSSKVDVGKEDAAADPGSAEGSTGGPAGAVA